MELENFMQQLNSVNHNKHPITFETIDAVRLKMRIKETNEETEGALVSVERVEGSVFDF
jgi:hypothetical protein